MNIYNNKVAIGLYCSMLFLGIANTVNAQKAIELHVDAAEKIASVTQFFNGTNIEDLNNQTNGGIFSQLLHGEAFEEHVEVADFLALEQKDYSKIYLVLDERKIPHLITQSDIYHKVGWNNLSEDFDFYSRDVYDASPFKRPEKISGWTFYSRFMPFDSIPSNIQQAMVGRINGKEQISRFWNKLVSGSPDYAYELVRDGKAYMGRQTQTICFNKGTGEVGVANYGLYKMGIRYVPGKPYEGVLRVKALSPTTIYLSLRDENGKVLTEKPYQLKGDGTYEKIEFELTPTNHSFGFIEMLQVAEVIDALCVIGMSGNESYEDIRDFVEYVNGSITSKWGKLRTAHGHPEPYNLKYIQVDNEKPMTQGYVQWIKKFAEAAWKSDPEMTIMTSVNLGRNGCKRGSKEYALVTELVGWFIAKGKGNKLAWDPHYGSGIEYADDKELFENELEITLQRELAKDYPGFKLRLMPMEENGSRCDWHRGLAHAHNWNTLQRYGDCFEVLATANTFQPYNLHYMWNQGRIHYTTDAMWFQPSAHIDELMMKTWKPNVVKTSSSDEVLDITAKINHEKTEMTLYIANLSDQPQKAALNIDNFNYKPRAEVYTIGGCELTDFNTFDNQNKVVFKPSDANMKKKNTEYIFPEYSYTVIILKK